MKTKDLVRIGVPRGEAVEVAKQLLQHAKDAKRDMRDVTEALRRIAAAPETATADPVYGEFARLVQEHMTNEQRFVPREHDAPHVIWGENLESEALKQLRNACKLPVAVAGALMPDAHVGYGLPIGGVLATRNAVIPSAVGVDIACRMKLSVLDLPLTTLDAEQRRLTDALERETRFGIGASFKARRQHDGLDAEWRGAEMTPRLKDTAG